MAFGLVSTSTVAATQSQKYRRNVFRLYPTGAAPLMGLMSLLPTQETDKPEFGWYEDRFPTQRTATAATGTAPFQNADGTALADLSTLTMDVEYRLKVLDTSQFKATHVIEIRELTINDVTTTTYNLTGVVTSVLNATTLVFRPTSTLATIDNASNDNFGKTVAIKGTANRENARSGTGIITVPYSVTNYTQIFRTAFNLSRTALKGGLQYDSRGPWKNQAWNNGLRHMMELEKAFLFGEKHEALVSDPETGEVTPEKKTGGVLDFLKRYEVVDSVYRGGSGAAAVTANSDSDKRIIDLGGTLTKVDYNTYIDRAFKKTSDKAYEKLAFCGGKFLSTINSLFERDVTRTEALNFKGKEIEFWVHTHHTLRGTVHYKVHPLFDDDPDLEDACLIMDVGNMQYRPLNDSDTEFLKGRQETDRDGRKDEWITEAGLELRFPQSFMYITNATAPA